MVAEEVREKRWWQQGSVRGWLKSRGEKTVRGSENSWGYYTRCVRSVAFRDESMNREDCDFWQGMRESQLVQKLNISGIDTRTLGKLGKGLEVWAIALSCTKCWDFVLGYTPRSNTQERHIFFMREWKLGETYKSTAFSMSYMPSMNEERSREQENLIRTQNLAGIY